MFVAYEAMEGGDLRSALNSPPAAAEQLHQVLTQQYVRWHYR